MLKFLESTIELPLGSAASAGIHTEREKDVGGEGKLCAKEGSSCLSDDGWSAK